MNKCEYNGWTNYETWLVNLWLTNEEHHTEHIIERVREFRDQYTEPDEFGPSVNDAKVLRATTNEVEEYVTDMVLEGIEEAGLRFDILVAFLREVNWKEIADHMIDAEYEAHLDDQL